MEHNILVHEDYCAEMCNDDVQKILSEITALITEAILRSAAESGGSDSAA